MTKLSIKDLDVTGKKILVRVDFNVPLDGEQHIMDATRIEQSLPTIQYLLKKGAACILMSHLGRPEGLASPRLSLKPCAKFLSGLCNMPVQMAPDCLGHQVETMCAMVQPKEILLLENLRFHRAEEYPEEDPEFAKQLASYGDIFVNDAFASAHRKHSSTFYVPKYFPGKSAIGFLMEKEVEFLSNLLKEPKRPFCLCLGGAKISTKIGVLKALIERVDSILIGGAMSHTFHAAIGKKMGSSLLEEDLKSVALEIIEECKARKVRLVLPLDYVVTDNCSNEGKTQVIDIEKGIPDGMQSVDIGPKTIAEFSKVLKEAETILWNGPMGVFEIKQFSKGTESIARCIGESKGVTIIGGGDSVAALTALGLEHQITHVSTGGGATLEFLEFGTLPGVEALSEAARGAGMDRG